MEGSCHELALIDYTGVSYRGRCACAFELIYAVCTDNAAPGEMVIAGPEGLTRERFAPESSRAFCVFEHVCFSRPDSYVFGRSVSESREMLGRLLARPSLPVEAGCGALKRALRCIGRHFGA